MKRTLHTQRGFTLIEMMVSVALFSVVMMVATVALLSMVDANKKAQALQSVMFNLNVAIDGMVRSIRMGTNYCIGTCSGASPVSDASGTVFSFCPFGRPSCRVIGHADEPFKITYAYDSVNKYIQKTYRPTSFGGTTQFAIPITSSEVQITDLKFYVGGVTTGDAFQPRVMMIIRGTAGTAQQKTTTRFDIQASATQRLLDI
jgi:prepilin-type N-terminal cleavage/methylation domain-containing protein